MKQTLSVFMLVCLLGGCAPITLTLPYTPQTTEEIDAGIKVNDFGYFPPDKDLPNQIHNTAAGTVLLTENVGVFFANAVRR
jgi:hypothetical protein